MPILEFDPWPALGSLALGLILKTISRRAERLHSMDGWCVIVPIGAVLMSAALTLAFTENDALPLAINVLYRLHRIRAKLPTNHRRCVTLSVRWKARNGSSLKVETALRVPGSKHPRQIHIAYLPARRLSDHDARRVHDAVIERLLPVLQNFAPRISADDLCINRKDLDRKILFVLSGRKSLRQTSPLGLKDEPHASTMDVNGVGQQTIP